MAVPLDPRRGCRKQLQRSDRSLSPVFLDKPDHAIEQDDHDDGDRIRRIADDPGNNRSPDQDKDHEVGKLIEKHAPERAWGLLTDFVQAILAYPTRSFIGAQAGLEINGKSLSNVPHRQRMPERYFKNT